MQERILFSLNRLWETGCHKGVTRLNWLAGVQ